MTYLCLKFMFMCSCKPDTGGIEWRDKLLRISSLMVYGDLTVPITYTQALLETSFSVSNDY
jgi:hypothetical protein